MSFLYLKMVYFIQFIQKKTIKYIKNDVYINICYIITMNYEIELNSYPIVLIDGSYYIFYRYFATLRWYKFQNMEVDDKNLITDENFIESFKKHFENDLKKICKTFKTIVENISICTDCKRMDIWRNDYVENYKGHRVHNDVFDRNIFDIFKEYIKGKVKEISGERLEADDVVAILHNKIHSICENEKVVIISNDNDYLQLSGENTTIMNMQLKDITTRKVVNTNKSELYMKALLGDKSDNIPKVKNVTKKKALDIINISNYDEMLKVIKEIDEENIFERNMKLIDFEKIPEKLVKDFLEKINIM